MLRVLLAAMVPCFAIGITGFMVMLIGRILLAAGHGPATVVAMVMTILIMIGCTIATYVIPRRRRVIRPTTPAQH
jgi:membrane-bound ClpP family serine protease